MFPDVLLHNHIELIGMTLDANFSDHMDADVVIHIHVKLTDSVFYAGFCLLVPLLTKCIWPFNIRYVLSVYIYSDLPENMHSDLFVIYLEHFMFSQNIEFSMKAVRIDV